MAGRTASEQVTNDPGVLIELAGKGTALEEALEVLACGMVFHGFPIRV
jgi:hypothetical protein